MAQVSKFDGIRKMAEALIKILSCSFRGSISFYTVREELDVLDSYIYLMKIRYSDGFEVDYSIDETCMDYKVPRLILHLLWKTPLSTDWRKRKTTSAISP